MNLLSADNGNSSAINDAANTNPIFNFTTEDDAPQVKGNNKGAIPPQVQKIFDQYGLGKENFSCTLSSVEPDGSVAYIEEYNRQVPTVPIIGKRYGPGKYRLTFQWTVIASGDERAETQEVDIVISEAFRGIHEEYQEEMAIQSELNQAKRLERAKRRRVIRDDIRGNDKRDPEEEFDRMMTRLVQMNTMMGSKDQKPSIDWQALSPIALAAVQYLQENSNKQQQQQQQMLMLMIQMMDKNNQNLMQIMQNKKPDSGSQLMDRVAETVLSAVNLKEAINPQKETIADRIFNTIEAVGPKLLEIAQMPKEQAQGRIDYKIAEQYMKNNENFKQMDKDPEILEALVNKLDPEMGWLQTDQILQVAGYERPDSLNGNRSVYSPYPEGDPRNEEYLAQVRSGQAQHPQPEGATDVQSVPEAPDTDSSDELSRRANEAAARFDVAAFTGESEEKNPFSGDE